MKIWIGFVHTVLSASQILCIPQLDPLLFSKTVQELVEDSLKIEEMQAELDSMTWKETALQEDIVDTIAQSIGDKISERNRLVRKLRDGVVKAYADTDEGSLARECCLIEDGLTYNQQFSLEVDTSKVCNIIRLNASRSSYRIPEASAFSEACVQNLKDLPTLRWQYFLSEGGVTTIFPSLRASACDGIDGRTSSWYVQSNVPRPKQVVVVIDKSNSMTARYKDVTLMDLAVEAAISVVLTLNPRDKFAVIAFSDAPETLTADSGDGSCFFDSMAQATPQNKDIIRQFLHSVKPIGGTYYGRALSKAFNYLVTEYASTSDIATDRVILFMSDGEPDDSLLSILQSIRSKQQLLNNSVVIMTYGVGSKDFKSLKQMTDNVNNPTKSGEFTAIKDPGNLRSEMVAYYKFFATEEENIEPRWTLPYIDRLGLGLMVTASFPVFVNGSLIGVTGLDAPVQDMFEQSTNFRPNDWSYTFIIDGSGAVVNHPLYKPSVYKSVVAIATTYEQDREFIKAFESMKRGRSGNITFEAIRWVQVGTRPNNYAKKVKVLSRYIWRKIPGANYSICSVLSLNGRSLALSMNESFDVRSILYHRIDIIPPKSPCNHLGYLASANQTSFFLPGRAFNNSDLYSSRNFTRTDVESIIDYIKGTSSNEFGLDENVKKDVLITQKTEDLWNAFNNPSDFSTFVFQRYICTKNSVLRVFPGVQIPKDFDPTTTFWYENAIANPDLYVLSAPYRDAITEEFIVTFSSALYVSSFENNKMRKEMYAVMGADLILDYFLRLFKRTYAEENFEELYKFYLLDQAGYIILSEDGTHIREQTAGNSSVKHLTEVEPLLSRAFVKRGILRRVSCSLIEKATLQRQHTLTSSQQAQNGSFRPIGSDMCLEFSLVRVPKTNLHILLISKEKVICGVDHSFLNYSTTCVCTGQQACSTSWQNLDECECPCTDNNEYYVPCSNEYRFPEEDNSTLCSPTSPASQATTPMLLEPDKYPACYRITFTPQDDDTRFPSLAQLFGISFAAVFLIFAVVAFLFWHKKQKTRRIEKIKSTFDTRERSRQLSSETTHEIHSSKSVYYNPVCYRSTISHGGNPIMEHCIPIPKTTSTKKVKQDENNSHHPLMAISYADVFAGHIDTIEEKVSHVSSASTISD